MSDIKISLCASAIRVSNWLNFYHSLLRNYVSFEVIFVGNVEPDFVLPDNFRYIYSFTKPAQCYEIAFRNARGELIHWTADDSTYSESALDNVYNFYKSFNDNKVIVSIRTVEDGTDITELHRFKYKDFSSPIMAPFGFIDKEFFRQLGGYDKRFICGQSENDVVMRACQMGGRVEICNDASVFVGHNKNHPSGTLLRKYYCEDRKILESLWTKDNIIQTIRSDSIQKYDDNNLLLQTQDQKGDW